MGITMSAHDKRQTKDNNDARKPAVHNRLHMCTRA